MQARIKLAGIVLMALSGIVAAQGRWVSQVPEQERLRQNPFQDDSNAVLAGEKIFHQHCTSCHGREAQGTGRRPNLHSETIRNAKPGELQWLLKNGSLRNGMPSWSRLPEPQRWQLVAYLKSLK